MEIYKLFNMLFGWDYVSVTTRNYDYRYLRRVRKSKDGSRYIIFTFGDLLFLSSDGTTDNGYIWRPLTW